MTEGSPQPSVSSDDGFVGEYHQFTLRRIVFIAATLIILAVLFGLSISIGERDIGFLDAYRVFFDHLMGNASYEYHSDLWWDDSIIWNTRLPRAALAIVAGMGLAVCGATMQSIMKNPLADPYITGISSAASLGAILTIVLGLSITSSSGQYGIVLNAFVFGMIPAVIIMLMSRFGNTSPATLILAGTAISYFFSSLSTLILTTSSEEDLASAYTWQVGSLSGTVWSDIPLVLVVVLGGSLALQLSASKLNLLTMGDESAKSLGLNASGFRMVCLCLMSLIAATIISFTGVIGFLGLVVPHIARLVIGSDNRFVIPASMALGALVLLAADLVGKSITAVEEIPVGVVMSFIGAPIFLYLILRQKREVW